jgi:hypothetical protein
MFALPHHVLLAIGLVVGTTALASAGERPALPQAPRRRRFPLEELV